MGNISAFLAFCDGDPAGSLLKMSPTMRNLMFDLLLARSLVQIVDTEKGATRDARASMWLPCRNAIFKGIFVKENAEFGF